MIKIRKGRKEEVERIMEMYRNAVEFMRRHGNPTQWREGYPAEHTVVRDLELGNYFLIEENEEIIGGFSLIPGEEPTYRQIEGEWLNEMPYHTIHRLVSSGIRGGIADICFAFCKEKAANIRIDTHKDNREMKRAIERNGFEYCGVIHVADGSPRIAYQILKNEKFELNL